MDIEHIRELVALMVENDLSRIEIEEGQTRIVLRRGQPIGHAVVSASPVPMPAAAWAGPPASAGAGPAASGPAASGPAAPGAEGEANEVLIRSPMVGTFYAAADPDSPPFAPVGTEIRPDTVVCLIEAMKVFNEIKADVAGRISRVLVKNAQAVEYDQPLFAVVPA